MDKATNKPRGFAFVNFEDYDSVVKNILFYVILEFCMYLFLYVFLVFAMDLDCKNIKFKRLLG